MNYNVNNENEKIIVGEVGENLAESCTIDYSAWVEEYGEGDLRIRAIREGDAEPYPVTNVETADGVATWTFTAADTAVKGFGEVQVLYYVGDVLAKSRVWKTYTYRSLNTSSEEVPDPYVDWLNAVERIGGQVEADAEAASVSADSASASATLAAGSASEAAESALSASRSASAAMGSASAASSSAESAASSATAASRSATEASNYEYYSEQYMNEAKSAKFGAESARTGAEDAKAAAQASATAAAQSATQAEETAESIEESADLIQKLLANQIKDTATGTIASFPDGADMPMVSIVADIDPIQDLHGYDRPWVGGAGKNLFNYEDVGSLSGLANNNGTFVNTDTDTKTAFAFTVQQYNGSTYVKGNNLNISASGRYFVLITIDSAITKLRIKHNGASKEFRFDYPFTKEGTFCVSIEVTSADPTAVGGVSFKNVMIESGSTMTAYEPYSNICPISGWDSVETHISPTTDAQDGQTITTTLPQTVYGGTLDVVSGVLTVDRAMVDLGSLTWNKRVSGVFYTWSLQNLVKAVSNNSQTANAKCSALKLGSYNDVYNNATLDYAISVGANSQLGAHCSAYAEAADFKSAMSGVQLVYELATPTTIQLTPTQIDSLLGRNSVWADSGDVTVEYIADTKLYIQKVIS